MSSPAGVARSARAWSSPRVLSPASIRSGPDSIAGSTNRVDRQWNSGPPTPTRWRAAKRRLFRKHSVVGRTSERDQFFWALPRVSQVRYLTEPSRRSLVRRWRAGGLCRTNAATAQGFVKAKRRSHVRAPHRHTWGSAGLHLVG